MLYMGRSVCVCVCVVCVSRYGVYMCSLASYIFSSVFLCLHLCLNKCVMHIQVHICLMYRMSFFIIDLCADYGDDTLYGQKIMKNSILCPEVKAMLSNVVKKFRNSCHWRRWNQRMFGIFNN